MRQPGQWLHFFLMGRGWPAGYSGLGPQIRKDQGRSLLAGDHHKAPVEVAMVSHTAQVDHSVTDPKRAATDSAILAWP